MTLEASVGWEGTFVFRSQLLHRCPSESVQICGTRLLGPSQGTLSSLSVYHLDPAESPGGLGGGSHCRHRAQGPPLWSTQGLGV